MSGNVSHIYHSSFSFYNFFTKSVRIAAIDYHSGRKLNKALINRLVTCEYITEYRNIFITGATGNGKTYMACAFGMEACKHYYSVRYVRLPDLLLDLQALPGTTELSRLS